MKRILLLSFILASLNLSAQVLEVPTLKSKGIVGKATKVALSQFEFVKDKGLILTQADVETYDDKARLVSIERTVYTTGLKYLYTYKLSKKGLLEQEKIANAANNQTVRITDYSYKKGALVSTTQVQGTVTTVKNYTYNKNGYLTGVKVLENGGLKGEALYQVDEQGRRTRTSQKLATDEVARTISTFNYVQEGELEIKVEMRNVNNIKYEIITRKDLETNRNLKETTKNLSNSQSGFNNFLFVDDEKGSWIKGEIIDNQLGRSRLILRKITYADGTVTGRTEWSFGDDRARYYRQYDKCQVAYNGKVVETGTADDLPNTNDRLTFYTTNSATILLKGYGEKAYQSNWHEAQIISNSKDDLFWIGKGSRVDVYAKGRKLTSSLYSSGSFSSYSIGNSAVVYASKEVRKSFVANQFDSEENKGVLHKAQLSDDHYYWGKASDTTYILVGYGSSITLKYQTEDPDGNNLVRTNTGDGWYVLPDFRENFNNGKSGDVFPAVHLNDPFKEIQEQNLFSADFSTFKHDNLKNNKYRLKTADGLVVTNLTIPTVKTSDKELITYFPLTKQYLRMDGYYTLPDDKDALEQPVTVLLDGSKDVHYIHSNGASIDFYKSGVKVGAHTFGVHKLKDDTRRYGAVLYDSMTTFNYGMSYDLSKPDQMGAMTRLPINQSHAYLLKLEGDRWVVFEKGVKVANYDYSAVEEGTAYYFFKDTQSGKAKAYRFEGYKEAKPGEFVAAYLVSDNEVPALSTLLNIDPLKPLEELPKGKPNSFKKDSASYWLWDSQGEAVFNYLQSFGSLGTDHLFVQDTVLRITYQLMDYMGSEMMEGEWEVVVGPKDNAVIKWGESNVAFLISGKLSSDVKRVYVNNEPDVATWTELVYKPSNQQTYLMAYPSKGGFYLGSGELLPTGEEGMVLTKLPKGQFSIVKHGVLDRTNSFKSGIYEGDLIYWTENESTGERAYRFRGFMRGKKYDLFYPEVVSKSELKAMGGKIEMSSKDEGG